MLKNVTFLVCLFALNAFLKVNLAIAVYIMDARPRINAVANQLKGLGYEKGYEKCSINFLNIQNIHKMREAENKLRKLMLSDESMEAKLAKVEATKWLRKPQTNREFFFADLLFFFLQITFD
jgi:uncharacterized membrane protein